MLSHLTAQHGAAQQLRPLSRPSTPSAQGVRARSIDGSAGSWQALRRVAVKLIVREIVGYGTRPDGKGLVLACAWSMSLRTVEDLMSLTSERAIGDALLRRLDEPARSQVRAVVTAIDAMSLLELREWVDVRRPLRGRVAA